MQLIKQTDRYRFLLLNFPPLTGFPRINQPKFPPRQSPSVAPSLSSFFKYSPPFSSTHKHHPLSLFYNTHMGFPYVVLEMSKSINVSFLLNLLGYFKSMVLVALAYLGLFKTPQEAYSEEFPTTYVLVGWPTPSLVPIPAHILMATIKKRVPVVEYSEFLKRLGMGENKETVCAVCLDCVERSHEMRELSNCSHVFHRECLDNWVDVGQVTCPLCRSMLFPAKGDMTRCGGDPWMMKRNSYLFGEDDVLRTS